MCSSLNDSWWLLYLQKRGSQQFDQKGLHWSLPRPIYQLLHLPVFHDAKVSILKCPLQPHSFSSTRILFHTRADSVVDFVGAAIAVLLSEQKCILCPIMFFNKRILCAPKDCHHFSLKHCRESAHRNLLSVVICWSINTCIKAVVNSWPIHASMSVSGLVILSGIHQSSPVGINASYCFRKNIFLRILSCFNLQGYFWGTQVLYVLTMNVKFQKMICCTSKNNTAVLFVTAD